MSEPTNEELDRWAAEEVMGWTQQGIYRWVDANGYAVIDGTPWHPSADPGDDYRVLKRIRATWIGYPQQMFVFHCGFGAHNYKPGGWTRAAWAVWEQQQKAKE